MNRTVKHIIIILLIVVLHPVSVASSEWEFIADDGGIALYAREVNGYPEKQFKGVCTVSRTLEAVGFFLSDIDAYPEWFFKCIEAKKIPARNSSDFQFLLYVAIETPWPFSNRDVVYKTDVSIDFASETVIIKSIALKKAFIPVKEQYVRITNSEHQWILERISAERTRITFMNRTNVAGPFANYISNSGTRDTTLYSLENLKKILNRQQNSNRDAN
jgi:hypothetical protein